MDNNTISTSETAAGQDQAIIIYNENLVYEPGTVVMYKGQSWRVCKNQTLYNLTTGKISATKQTTTKITSESRHALNATRKESARQAAARGLARVRAGKNPQADDQNALEAWADIVEAQGKLAKNTDQGRSSTGAAVFVGRAAGFLSKEEEQTAEKPVQVAVIISDQVAEALLTRVNGVDNYNYQQQGAESTESGALVDIPAEDQGSS